MNANGTDWSTVGSQFRERRLRLKMTQEQIAEAADVHRDTVSAVEAGGGGITSQRKMDDALALLEEEGGLPPLAVSESDSRETPPLAAAPNPEASFIRFRVEGVYGAKALIVEGPVENMQALEAAVDRIMRRLASGEQE